MYGNDTDETDDRRLPWMDLGEVRKTILTLLEETRIDVHWDHLVEQGHDVTDEEIRTTLAEGTFGFHNTIDGRYVAMYDERETPLAIVVVLSSMKPVVADASTLSRRTTVPRAGGRARRR